jgi:geranylgeranyl reductase family protein
MAGDSFDIVVVGAGPAGAVAAYAAARRGLNVALVDRRTFPRDKACGDGIGPGAVQVLRRLGLGAIFEGHPAVTELTVFAPDGGRLDSVIPPIDGRPMYGHIITRYDFDDYLVRAAISAGATDLTGVRYLGMTSEPDLRRVELRGSDGTVFDSTVFDSTVSDVGARLVIGADGAYSAVRKTLTGDKTRRSRHQSIALRAYASSDDFLPGGRIGQRLVLDYSSDLLPGYGWLFPLGDGRVNLGVGMPVNELKRRDDELKSVLAAFVERTRSRGIDLGELHDQRAHHLPHVGGMPRLTYPRAALLGDAASMINPVSGEGIAYAVTAAADFIDALPGDLSDGERLNTALARFERDFRRRYRAHFLSCRLYLEMMRHQRPATSILRALQRDPRVLHAGVNLLFGFGSIHPRTVLRILASSRQG